VMANRILILIIGLLTGIIVGGGAFWYLTGSTGRNVFIVNEQPVNKQSEKKAKAFSNKPLKSSNKRPDTVQTASKDIVLSTDSIYDTSEQAMDVKKPYPFDRDSLLLALNKDSAFSKTEEEIIVVKKDELLLVKMVNFINLDSKSEDLNAKKDSAISALAGIKEPFNANNLTIEFWKSPINYRGYKMNRNKLVLFGMQSSDIIKVFKLNENIYFKNGEKVYRVEKITDFKPYEMITDPNIINQLH
jgi:hypothetical protein